MYLLNGFGNNLLDFYRNIMCWPEEKLLEGLIRPFECYGSSP